ncbi:MAG TPA: cysteine--tRNA ligase [Firmicutes bacterium]|nr:cysteine--tRNA ligase [Bacillota bacterium]
MVRIYNTLTRQKEEFKPLKEGKVGIYSCGPTVYDYFHIGNARPFIVFDLLRRYLRYRNYEVVFVQNFTDIDDKMIRRAEERKISFRELAAEMIDAYYEDAAALGIEKADRHPRATEFIPQMIELINKLLEKGAAYTAGGNVYFSVESFKEYGKLSRQSLQDLFAGARVEVGEAKRYAGDFALWKQAKPGEPFWESPFGPGRPGWHIECSTMAMAFLGDTIDIHGGGPDLIFPHHENEIAQSEAATGVTFARYWMHVGYLNINEEKMSKSAGNFLTVRELRQIYDPLVIRFFMLSSHYRNPINFNSELIEQAGKGLARLRTMVENLEDMLAKMPPQEVTTASDNLGGKVEEAREAFISKMDEDLNTAEGIGVLFDLAREVNTYLNAPGPKNRNSMEQALRFYREADDVLGFIFPPQKGSLEEDINLLIEKREEARRLKDWAKADAIRAQLAGKGILLEDTPHGVRWRKK